jgi:hypothetical protein
MGTSSRNARWLAAATVAIVVAACSSDKAATPTTTAVATTTTAVATTAVDTTTAETAAPTIATVSPTSVSPDTTESTETTETATTIADDDAVMIGAASRSILPTVDGTRDYVADVPGWSDVDPWNPGLLVPNFDQGAVDVGNGNSDAAWVHDDLKASAVAIQRGDSMVVMVSVDVYMIFAADGAEIEARARKLLPAEWAESAKIIIAATHDHEGPDSAFSVNDDWYDAMADEVAAAISEAVGNVEPATLQVATGEHRFGVADARDPFIVDPALRVMTATSVATGDAIATMVQWGSHPETTLGFEPKDGFDISAGCTAKGWTGDDCYAEGRYFSADYPGVLRDLISTEIGGEVLYFNGAIGVQIGPGDAPVWHLDEDHPVGNGWSVPDGAVPVEGAKDFLDENFATTVEIGTELATHVLQLVGQAEPVDVTSIDWREQPYYTRLTNIGFRVLLSDGDLGWQVPNAWNCTLPLSDETCVSDGGAFVDDPVLTPLTESQVRVGDVLRTRLVFVGLGDVGFLFMPGELPPELVSGLPADFDSAPEKYFTTPGEDHVKGVDYAIPGYLLNLVPTTTTFVVGLGGDELGYFVPLNEVKVRCAADILGPEGACQAAFDAGVIDYPDGVGGPVCKRITDDPASLDGVAPDLAKVAFDSCRYGQALGRELGEPPGHYEETNSAGWDLVDDNWAAAVQMFGKDDPTQINPDNPGYTLQDPPPEG